jgi:signal transduction histidine kinase
VPIDDPIPATPVVQGVPATAALRLALEAVPDPVLLCDRSLRILWGNHAARRTLAGPVRLLDRLLPELCPEWASGVIIEEALPALAAHGVWSGGAALLRQGAEDPATLWLQGDASSGTVAAVFRTGCEASRPLEEQLGSPAGPPAARGWLAEVTHELRTPLTGILGMSELLGDTAASAEQRELIAALRHSATVMKSLIDDILDLSRLDAGRVELVLAPWRPRQLLGELEGEFALRLRAKGVALAVNCGDDVPPQVRGDAFRVRQVLANLLSNALKFTDRGTVTLGAAWEDGRLALSVADTGIGIPSEALGRLFAPFQQADPGIARRFGGSGLGLAICKRLIDLMGGDLSVSSTVGRGSTFRISVPASAHADV